MKSRYTKLRLLCRTLAGNGVYYLTITAPSYDEEARRKRGIVVTARVHPGETPSSWTMKGIIDFLTGESNQARVQFSIFFSFSLLSDLTDVITRLG